MREQPPRQLELGCCSVSFPHHIARDISLNFGQLVFEDIQLPSVGCDQIIVGIFAQQWPSDHCHHHACQNDDDEPQQHARRRSPGSASSRRFEHQVHFRWKLYLDKGIGTRAAWRKYGVDQRRECRGEISHLELACQLTFVQVPS